MHPVRVRPDLPLIRVGQDETREQEEQRHGQEAIAKEIAYRNKSMLIQNLRNSGMEDDHIARSKEPYPRKREQSRTPNLKAYALWWKR